jgi:hypothetical protein
VIDHALFRYSYSYAIYAANCSPTISNTTFYKAESYGLYLVGSAAPTVEFCTFDDLTVPDDHLPDDLPGKRAGQRALPEPLHGEF